MIRDLDSWGPSHRRRWCAQPAVSLLLDHSGLRHPPWFSAHHFRRFNLSKTSCMRPEPRKPVMMGIDTPLLQVLIAIARIMHTECIYQILIPCIKLEAKSRERSSCMLQQCSHSSSRGLSPRKMSRAHEASCGETLSQEQLAWWLPIAREEHMSGVQRASPVL